MISSERRFRRLFGVPGVGSGGRPARDVRSKRPPRSVAFSWRLSVIVAYGAEDLVRERLGAHVTLRWAHAMKRLGTVG